MWTERVRGVVTAKTPIHHGGDLKTGSEVLLRRIKYIVAGKVAEIPYIDGNAVRGYLRRLVMADFLERIGYEPRNPTIYYMFFSGGVLEEVSTEESGVIDVELRKKIRSLIPPLSVFGTSFMNQAFTGKMIVGKLLPICRELNDFNENKSEVSVYSMLDFTFNTRRDELKARSEEEQAVQMIYSYEVFIPGTRFEHYFTLIDMNEVEKSMFKWMITLWKQRPYIGGRSAVGNGEVEIEYKIPEKFPGTEVYLNFVKENAGNILELLESLEKYAKAKKRKEK